MRGTVGTSVRLVVAVLGLVLASIWPASAAAFVPPPMRDAVTDTAGRLTDADDRALEERITAYRNRTGNEIAVLVIGSLGGASIEDVAYGTFNEWHLGKKGLDNGVLLVIAPTERKTRIETGKGIGDRLTDIDCGLILRERVGPLLKEDRFHEAIDAALDAIEAALDGRPEPPLPTSLTKTPLVRGAFVIDGAGALDEATLAALEADAANAGRYWKTFAVIVVPDPPVANGELAKRINDARAGVPGLHHAYVDFYFVGAKSRRVALFHTPTMTEAQWANREQMLSAPVQAAPTLEAGIRALAAARIAQMTSDEARARQATRVAEQRQKEQDRTVSIILGSVAAFILGVLGLFAYAIFRTGRGASRRSRAGGSSSYASSSSYDAPSYGSSSSDSSYGSSSSSVDTSYSGGGGSSGGGGASDSY